MSLSTEAPVPRPQAFVSIKVSKEFRRWLKTEAAQRGLPMYRLLERIVETGHGAPWRSQV